MREKERYAENKKMEHNVHVFTSTPSSSEEQKET